MDPEIIRPFALFSHLPGSELQMLADMLEECAFPAGEVLFREGSLSGYFFLVLDGEVEIVKSLDTPDERVLAVSTAGSILGEMSMFSTHGTHTASARAGTALRLLKITFEQFDAILHRHPDLAYDLLRLFSSRLEVSESLTIRDLREKNRQLTLAYQELQAAQAAMIEKEKLEHELSISAEIQRGILPEELPVVPGLEFGALMIPARQVGGDFYDFIPLDEQRVAVVVGDVCDKGMPAALFMALTCSAVRAEAPRQETPGNTLRAVNAHLLQMNRSGMFVTLLYGVLDCRTREFTYARAGHPRPLLLDGAHQPMNVPSGLGQPIGLFDTPAIDEQCIRIPPGGLLLAYSDGLSETVEGTPGSPPLPELCSGLLQAQPLEAQTFCGLLWQTVNGPSEVSLIQDDFTLVVIRGLG
jgi:phosphoserine phosphatase RsbU/P